MSGFRVFVFFLLSALFASCVRETVVLPVKPDVIAKGDTARKTLLVYMMAENSLNNFAAKDILEIAKAATDIPRDCRLFVYVDDCSFPVMHHYFSLTNGDYGSSEFHLFQSDVCSSDTAVLGAVLDYILTDFPTESLDLVLWSHGDGWLRQPASVARQRTIGIDNGQNTYSDNSTKSIEIEELAVLLERLPVRVRRLMFDACFMQCVESGYALRNAAEWIIASPAEIPGDGAPYETVVPAFFSFDGPCEIMDLYVQAYEEKPYGAVLSAVRCEELGRLADVTYYYVNKYFDVDSNRDYADVFSYLPGGKYTGSKKYPCYYDINAVMAKYLTPDEYDDWRVALDSVVVYVASSPVWYSALCARSVAYDVSVGCGLSLYMPRRSSYNDLFNACFRTTEWYTAAGWQVAGW